MLTDNLKSAYAFDDVLLVPAYSAVLPLDVILHTHLTTNLRLNIPIISAAMDTVTEAAMAIALAQEGGIGIIHKNNSIASQAEFVRQVKRHESGIVKDPVTIHPEMSVAQLLELTNKLHISGVPVVLGQTLVGVVTNRDVRFETNLNQPVCNIMTKRDQLVTINESQVTIAAAKHLLHQHKLERILVVDDNFCLRGLITVKDINKNVEFPLANKDACGRLRVGAAIGIAGDNEQRAAALVGSGVDVLVIDTAHGHSVGVIAMLKWLKANFPTIDVIAGNVATKQAACALVDAGANGIKVGIGPGSICTTRIVAGVGVPQLTAIADVANYLQDSNIPVIADGGIRFSGDIAKALAAGASAVMLGGLLAGTDESPGDIELYQGGSYKSYRGMGSLGAMSKGSADRYFQNQQSTELVPQGIEGRVQAKGQLHKVLYQLLGGLRAAMGYLGCESIAQLYNQAEFIAITSAGIKESHVHDVQIVKEAPNYNLT